MTVLSTYEKYTDKELVSLIVNEHVHEALIYMLYDRYYKDARFYAYRYYKSFDYMEDLMEELTLHMMGKHGDYSTLASYQGKSSFRTWISRVISNLFLKKMDELIGFGKNSVSNGDDIINRMPEFDTKDTRMVKLLEAIARLTDPDQKFVLIKELEGYKPYEIARMMQVKWHQENIVKYDNKHQVVVPSAPYVYNIKSRALVEVKRIMKTLKY